MFVFIILVLVLGFFPHVFVVHNIYFFYFKYFWFSEEITLESYHVSKTLLSLHIIL